MICRRIPFSGGKLWAYCLGHANFPGSFLDTAGVSKGGTEFLKGLLAPTPTQRPTASSALQSVWIEETETSNSKSQGNSENKIQSSLSEAGKVNSSAMKTSSPNPPLEELLSEETIAQTQLANKTVQKIEENVPFKWRSGRPMAGMLDSEKPQTRRERTFVGSKCALCDELLEHTFRGERMLPFFCGHVSHEACFYECIKEFESKNCPICNAPLGLDTSRGGNVFDLGNVIINESNSAFTHMSTEQLSSIIRSVARDHETRTNHRRNVSEDNSTSQIANSGVHYSQAVQERLSGRESKHRSAPLESSQPRNPRQSPYRGTGG